MLKEVNQMQKRACVRSEMILDKSGRLFTTKDELCKKGREYFKELIVDDDTRGMVINTIGSEVRRDWNRYRIEADITR